jgi:hypothetical protein
MGTAEGRVGALTKRRLGSVISSGRAELRDLSKWPRWRGRLTAKRSRVIVLNSVWIWCRG